MAYISSDEREKPATKNALIKTYIQILWRNQKLYIEAKAKRIQHYQTSFTTDAKGSSQAEEKATTRNKEIIKWKSSRIKATYNKGRKSSTDKANGEVKRQKR